MKTQFFSGGKNEDRRLEEKRIRKIVCKCVYNRGRGICKKKGEIEETMPRDREGSFEPIVVPKRKRLIDEVAEHVTLLYSKGNSIRDIKEILEEMYRTKMNEQFISEATKMVSEEVEEWKRRPLKEMEEEYNVKVAISIK